MSLHTWRFIDDVEERSVKLPDLTCDQPFGRRAVSGP